MAIIFCLLFCAGGATDSLRSACNMGLLVEDFSDNSTKVTGVHHGERWSCKQATNGQRKSTTRGAKTCPAGTKDP